ncbi:hypothetical protein M0Q50_10515 [bacterium]|jgi:hypothetical protein|nr:hypothetical protein [bacterium]
MSRIDKEYWIDNFGKIHKYKPDSKLYYDNPEKIISIHNVIAKQIYPDVKDPKKLLFDLGWIMIGSTVYGVPYMYKEPNQAQINTLDRLDLLDFLHISYNNFFLKYITNYENNK